MTINVAIVTSEALVLGCDSLGSFTQFMLDPARYASERLPDGTIRLTVSAQDFVHQVTKTWQGTVKMFALSDRNTPVAAIASGLWKLNGRSMSSYAHQFLNDRRARDDLFTVENVADAFLAFVRAQYERHYDESSRPEQYREAPFFLVGGYGRADYHPSLYRIDVLANEVTASYLPGRFGISWDGQTHAVERVLLGFDNELMLAVEDEIVARRDVSGSEFDWSRFNTEVDYGQLTVQEAVHFASYLIMVQSGAARFSRDVPRVGGQAVIGIVTRSDGFQILAETPITTNHLGANA